MTGLVGRMAPERAVLCVTGADARAILQDVVTNDLGALAPDRSVYAALLTPQGKYLFDFFLVDAPDGGLWVDVAADRAEALMARLKMYAIRRDMAVTAGGIPVWQMWDGGGGSHPPTPPPPPAGGTVVPDPRAGALGWRGYGSAALPDGIAAAQDGAWEALRVAHLVPETGVELVPDDTFILEAGFERLHGVDFRKGCYVGQEVTARMKHKTTLRKGLVRVLVTGDAAPGAVQTAKGKPAGTLFTVSGGRGLAHLRLDRADGTMLADGAEVVLDPEQTA